MNTAYKDISVRIELPNKNEYLLKAKMTGPGEIAEIHIPLKMSGVHEVNLLVDEILFQLNEFGDMSGETTDGVKYTVEGNLQAPVIKKSPLFVLGAMDDMVDINTNKAHLVATNNERHALLVSKQMGIGMTMVDAEQLPIDVKVVGDVMSLFVLTAKAAATKKHGFDKDAPISSVINDISGIIKSKTRLDLRSVERTSTDMDKKVLSSVLTYAMEQGVISHLERNADKNFTLSKSTYMPESKASEMTAYYNPMTSNVTAHHVEKSINEDFILGGTVFVEERKSFIADKAPESYPILFIEDPLPEINGIKEQRVVLQDQMAGIEADLMGSIKSHLNPQIKPETPTLSSSLSIKI